MYLTITFAIHFSFLAQWLGSKYELSRNLQLDFLALAVPYDRDRTLHLSCQL